MTSKSKNKKMLIPIEKLNSTNRERILCLLDEINEKLEMTANGTIEIKKGAFVEHSRQKCDDLAYLSNINLIKHAKVKTDKSGYGTGFKITVNRNFFFNQFKKIKDGLCGGLQDKKPIHDTKIKYDIENCTFYFGNEKLELIRNTKQELLCRMIFHNKKTSSKIWNFDEMLIKWNLFEEIDIENATKKDLHSIYSTARVINIKINTLSDGKIPKIFDNTLNTTRLNPKYLDLIKFN